LLLLASIRPSTLSKRVARLVEFRQAGQSALILLELPVTLSYLRGEKAIAVPEERREKDKGSIKIKGGNAFNIKNLDIEVPLGRMVAVTGVSGSGKSTFLYELLYENLRARYDKRYRTNKVYNAAKVDDVPSS